jgi:multiple sugar transport system ATP-binding protein
MGRITIEGLRKNFGSFEALKAIDLTVSDGEFVALVGPSGCGKSTLLRLVAGLEEATGGFIRIGKRMVNSLSPRERNVAMVFQGYALYPHMTVAENMSFNLKLAKNSKSEIGNKVRTAAQMLKLTSLLDRYPSQLSGGQRQRVAMGRALVRHPDVFLFDEPLSNLDAKLRGQMRAEIKTLHQTLGITALYVTHDQIEAMTLADRVVVLDGGRIQQQGRPLDLYHDPLNKFVAGFIGSPPMNFLNGVVERNGDRTGARVSNLGVVDLGLRGGLLEGREVTLGLRPEHILYNGGSGSLPAIVRLIEPTGAQTHITCELAGQMVVALVESKVEMKVGDVFHLFARPESWFLFDLTTGERIRA